MNEKDKLYAKLTLSWIERARGKTSHGLFNGCVGNAMECIEEISEFPGKNKVLDLLGKSELHKKKFLDVAESIIRKTFNITEDFAGNMPEIEELEEEIELLGGR